MIQNQEVILLRNMVVPIVRLNKILEVPGDHDEKKNMTVVIVKKGEKTSGFLVDSLIGQREVVIKSLGKLLSGIKVYCRGNYIRGWKCSINTGCEFIGSLAF